MQIMKTIDSSARIPAEVMAELHAACDKLARGERDIEAAKKAAEEMDLMREANRRRFGIQNIAVELVRKGRDSR
jgi:hypothetical protein